MSRLQRAVGRAIRTFEEHPECIASALTVVDDSGATVALTLNVEMPLKWRAKGESPNGVRRVETVNVHFASDYPWSAPRFTLRQDFDRNLPHIQPGRLEDPLEPCLVFGSLDEFFLEVGLYMLVEQLCDWLNRAAKGALISPSQGWEPIVRNRLVGEFIVDIDFVRGLVDRRGGCAILRSEFLRKGPTEGILGHNCYVFGRIYSEKATLTHSAKVPLVGVHQLDANTLTGHSIAIVVWPGKAADGTPIEAANYFPETIESLGDLLSRANELGCDSALADCLDRLNRVFQKFTLPLPVPIPVILCVRRPLKLINSASSIELLPYAFDLRLEINRPVLTKHIDLPVIPIAQLDALSQELFQRASHAPRIQPVAMLGAGSVGSKVALHLARNGTPVLSVADNQWLRPHNLARHGLASTPHDSKATALAKALSSLGQTTQPHDADILTMLPDVTTRRKVLPAKTRFVIDTTASLQVRSMIANLNRTPMDPRYSSMALFGGGRGAYLMTEGHGASPSLEDVANEYYVQLVTNDALRAVATGDNGELQHVFTGQGCGSLTMRMTDARVSAMTAVLTEQFVDMASDPPADGMLLYGVKPDGSIDTQWTRLEIEAPVVVDITGPDNWRFRLSPRAVAKIRADIAQYLEAETGGILMGRVNERLRTISVVDVLPASPDSRRSATTFVLGVEGGKESIRRYYDLSGRTLYDVGTWHSHLADEPPSPRDRATAKELAAERPPPYALLIVSPCRYFGIMHAN